MKIDSLFSSTPQVLDSSYEGTSISHATLRDEDLLERFVGFLLGINDRMVNRELESSFGVPLAIVREIDWDTYCSESDPDDTSYLINEELFDLLNRIAPEGTCFGSHEGDGSDFGFWSIDLTDMP